MKVESPQTSPACEKMQNAPPEKVWGFLQKEAPAVLSWAWQKQFLTAGEGVLPIIFNIQAAKAALSMILS